jgi:hypothetical protein
MVGGTFLIEGFSFSAVDESFEDNWAVADSKDGSGSHRQVIPDEFKFGQEDGFGEIELVRMGDLDLVGANGEELARIFRHRGRVFPEPFPGI